ncbi:aspartate aminotransferase family protein [Nodosilinea sp. E11]|uniref:aspartate aminotransferase family protein n=1 Tax=Nodosilinea sp. E11 TaxID=3037479 RepID=UPI0029343870|nr:aspartate aminotransferase family protein [Nodosilinea sp. E11]WOD40356.1 aspartate aminotransferase family protein [Nodosilinea sp. E11]
MADSIPDRSSSAAPPAPSVLPAATATDEDLWAVAEHHLVRYGGSFAPRLIQRARGSYLYDRQGRQILDFTSGQMCATLGHNHPDVVQAIHKACTEVLHLFSGMLSPAVIELADSLCGMLPPPLQKALFLNTGSEANEAALRMAKLHTGGFEVVGLSASWHGMTAGASASTFVSARKGYGPTIPGNLALPTPNCYRCPIRHCQDQCDMTCLEVGFELVDSQSVGAYAAVIAEPVLSAGGVVVPPPGYFQRLQSYCQARGMVLILDEAQTAFGRLGSLFAFEQLGIVPDILTLSKTLGGGLPLAATVTSEAIETHCYEQGFIYYTSHVSDPMPAEVGLAVLRVLTSQNLVAQAATQGAYLKQGLLALQDRYDIIGDVRGQGLLLGVELVKNRDRREPDPDTGAAITRRCLELGLSMNITALPGMGSVWRIAPPLTVTTAELDQGLAILEQAIGDCIGSRS